MLLLDSQALVWLMEDNPKLGKQTREKIARAVAVHFSSASIWELTIKAMLNKLTLPDGFHGSVIDAGLTELPLTSAHASAISLFPQLVRHDPFDRLLIAQASVENLQLITADRVLLALSDAPVFNAAS